MALARARVRAALWLVGAATAVALGACSSPPRAPLSYSIPGLTAKPVLRLAWIDNYPRAIATIAYILEHELKFPPVDASLRFYGSREALAEALVTSGYDAEEAHRITASIGALAADGKIILNESALMRRPWPQRIAVIAHELTHAVQYQLAEGRRGTSDQWLREGFAEWAAVRVLERLEVTTLGRMRYMRMRRVRSVPDLPPLSRLSKNDHWLTLGARIEDAAVYPYAFLAVDLLVQQHGSEKVVDYFRMFATTQDREWAFQAAFGQDVAAFERVLRARVHDQKRTPLRPANTK